MIFNNYKLIMQLLDYKGILFRFSHLKTLVERASDYLGFRSFLGTRVDTRWNVCHVCCMLV